MLRNTIDRTIRHVNDLSHLVLKEQEKMQSLSAEHLCDLMVQSQKKVLLIDSSEDEYCRPSAFIPVVQIEKTVSMKETTTTVVQKKEKGYFSASSSSSPFP